MRKDLESLNEVEILDAVIFAAANLATHFLLWQPLPDCVINLIDEAATVTRVELYYGTEEISVLEKRMRQIKIEICSLECDGETLMERLAAA